MNSSAYDQACDWIVRLDSAQASAADRAAFVRWLNRSQENAHAYEEMAQVWARLDTMAPEVREPLPHLQPDRWYFHLPRLVASLVAVIGLMVAMVLWAGLRPTGPERHQFVTASDQHFEYLASDGSTMRLSSLTSLAMDYSADRRLVTMQHGNASFDVTANPKRPFIVLLDDYVAQALGTRFGVQRSETAIHIQVREGSVSFSRDPNRPGVNDNEGQAPFVILQAGQGMHFDLATETLHVDSKNANQPAWPSFHSGNQ